MEKININEEPEIIEAEVEVIDINEVEEIELEEEEEKPELIEIEEPEPKVIVEKETIIKEKAIPWKPGKNGKTPTKTELKKLIKEVFPEDKLLQKLIDKLPTQEVESIEIGEDRNWQWISKNGKKMYIKSVSNIGAWMSTWVYDFIALRDTPNSYAGQAWKSVKVKSDETGLEFGDAGGSQNLQEVTDEGNTTTNDIEANSFIKTGGTSSQFLKADGSVDSSTYLDWTLTATRIPFASDSNTLTDKNDFDYLSATNTLNNFLTETERFTNPNFTGNASGWGVNSWWAYNSNAVYHSSNGTWVLTQTPTIYNWGYYKLTIVAVNPQSGSWVGTITVTCGGVSVGTISSAGTYTYYVLATNNSSFSLTPSNTGRFGVDSCSLLELTAWNIRSGNLYANELVIAGNKSNYWPWTTRHISLKNYGSNTWIDTYFGNTAWPVLWFDSGGNMQYRATSGGQHVFYNASQASLYIASVWTLVYGYLGTQGGVNVGSTTSPKTKLQVNWSAGYSWEYISSETTLTSSSPKYIITNADEGSSCGGSPSTACSTHTNQTDCELRNSHGWCAWSTVFSCGGSNSVFSSCGGDNSTPNTCYDQPDEWSCLSASCYWNGSSCEGDNSTPNTCPDQYDESSCSGAGCTPDMTPNTCPDYMDYDSCYNAGCTPWETGSCAGTPTCSGIPIWDCASEAWCSVTGGLPITMPNDNLYGGTSYFQTFFIRNKGTTYNTTLYPNPSSSGQTINGTTSVVLWPWESGHFAFHYITRSCSTWNGDSSACGSKSGCSYQSCSGLGEEDCINAGGVCSWDSMTFTCTGTGNCTGTNTVMKDWASYPCTF